MREINRRRFLESTAMLSAAAALHTGFAGASRSPKKAVLITMLPKELPYLERFKLALDAGFEGIEMQTVTDPKTADEIREASSKSGLKIHSVMNMAHWDNPLSSDDPEVVNKSVMGMGTSLRTARPWRVDAVLLSPAVVNPQRMSQDGYRH